MAKFVFSLGGRIRGGVSSATLGGGIIVASIIALTFASLWQLASIGGEVRFNHSILSILQFSFLQAGLSTALSLVFGVMLGRAYVRCNHILAARLLAWLFNGSFLLPVVVAVFGLIAVHGLSGWVNHIIGGSGGRYIYGFSGIIIAHVFFNAPLAGRFVYQALVAVPEQHWRLAQQLGLLNWTAYRRFFLMDYPAIKPALFSSAAVIFLLCFTSFAIVLILGSGLYATLEVAIYQSLRLQFQPSQAAFLACLQIAMCLIIAACLLFLGKGSFNNYRPPQKQHYHRPDGVLLSARITDGVTFFIATALIVPVFASLPPAMVSDKLLAVIVAPSFARAILGSLSIAPAAAVLSVSMAWMIAIAARHVKLREAKLLPIFFEVPAFLVLVIPPLTLSAGLFLLFFKFGLVGDYVGDYSVSLGLVIVINGLFSLPFALAILSPPLHQIATQHNHLAESLGLKGWRRWRLIEFPLMQRSLGLALGLSAALGVGDVSAIALFGTQDFTNLPLLLYRLLGSYRTEEAGIVSVALCIILFVLFYSGYLLARLITLRGQYVKN